MVEDKGIHVNPYLTDCQPADHLIREIFEEAEKIQPGMRPFSYEEITEEESVESILGERHKAAFEAWYERPLTVAEAKELLPWCWMTIGSGIWEQYVSSPKDSEGSAS